MTTSIAKPNRAVARPIKVLVPLIQEELDAGNSAGLEHYRRAGEMLLEAKEQVTYGRWGQWLRINFSLSQETSRRYMILARKSNSTHHVENDNGNSVADFPPQSINQATGATQKAREKRAAYRPFREEMRGVEPDNYAQEKQVRDEEVRLHRELAEQLIDLGYRALAMKLHPDRGGSKDAMIRLNRVRDQLKEIAQTRRFV